MGFCMHPRDDDNNAEVKVKAKPKDAQVYVDGYYAGPVNDFNGIFQHLNVAPGGHEIELYKDGFRTIHQRVNLQPGSSFTMHDTMVPLAPGQQMEAPPSPAAASAYAGGAPKGHSAD